MVKLDNVPVKEKVARVCVDHVAAVSSPPTTDPDEVTAVIVPLVGRLLGDYSILLAFSQGKLLSSTHARTGGLTSPTISALDSSAALFTYRRSLKMINAGQAGRKINANRCASGRSRLW